MKRYIGAFVLASCALPAFAGRAPAPAAEIRNLLPDKVRIETRADGDLNGDGDADTVVLWRREESNSEERGLRVILADEYEGKLGWISIGEVKLDPFPLGAGSLAIRKGVLVFEDLTGGTTATASTRRYRYDAGRKQMRLIGIDAERYSRTNSHGTVKISWNLSTGAYLLERGEPNTDPKSDAALVYAKPERTVRKTLPVWLEETPDPDELIDAETMPDGEDRD